MKDNWTSVKDSVPKVHEHVLIAYKGYRGEYVVQGGELGSDNRKYGQGLEWRDHSALEEGYYGHYSHETITHVDYWMPYPEPPKH